MYLAIISLPLLGSIISGFFGRKIGVKGAHIITCTSVIITTVLAIVGFIEVGINNKLVTINLFRWIDSESLNVLWNFNFDSLTTSMLIPVLIVSSLVHIYSISYMSHDPHNQRFFSYLSLFTFMMVILVTADNFLLMFVGWEGVGVCSYLLVNFWYTRIAANQSSISAFLTNRVGDCFLTIGMFAILWSFGNIDYATIFSLAPFINENIITLIGLCLLIGAMAKSSQVGLHVWLPMAMEGPTPVSALIHAATMVTAGVYLLIRCSPLIEYSSTVLLLCLWLGAITTVFSSLIGLFQQDIKKVIAYSTMSQLGMMVIAIGLSSYNIALFHLVNHAFYKALLFLGAGAVIHAVADNQDLRKYGGLIYYLPLTYSVMLIASLSLVAFPFMTGFFSKDFILESAFGQFYFSSIAVYFIAVIGAIFTTLYSVKVLYLTFLSNPNGAVKYYSNDYYPNTLTKSNYIAHEGDIFLTLPLVILAVFSIFFGYFTKDLFIGLGSGFFIDNSLFIHPNHEIMLDTEFAVPTLFKLLPLFFTITFSILAIIFFEFIPTTLIKFKLSKIGSKLFGFFNQRFLIEMFYNNYITKSILNLGGKTTKELDKGSVEILGPYGLETTLLSLSTNIAKLDSNQITSYGLYNVLGLIFFLILCLINGTEFIGLLILLSIFTLFTNRNLPTNSVNISNSNDSINNEDKDKNRNYSTSNNNNKINKYNDLHSNLSIIKNQGDLESKIDSLEDFILNKSILKKESNDKLDINSYYDNFNIDIDPKEQKYKNWFTNNFCEDIDLISLNDSKIEEEYDITKFYETPAEYPEFAETSIGLKKEIIEKINAHNSKLIINNKSEKDRKIYLDYVDYNMPGINKEITVTPLMGTDGENYLIPLEKVTDIYGGWRVIGQMLVPEFNVLLKARKYIHNLYSINPIDLDPSFEKSYNTWLNRQLKMIIPPMKYFINQGFYITNLFEDHKAFYRIICEDYLYVLLNLKILNNVLKHSTKPFTDKEILSQIECDISAVYKDHSKVFKYLEELRRYEINYYMTQAQIDHWKSEAFKEIENKKKKEIARKKLERMREAEREAFAQFEKRLKENNKKF